jgi:hypothetical protein
VSRGSRAWSAPPTITIDRMSEASITVTATARTRVPNGSPTRCAITSAWCTDAITAPTSAATQSSVSTTPTPTTRATTSSTIETTGVAQVQVGMRRILDERRL